MTATAWWAVGLAAVGTFATRASFLMIADRLRVLPPWVRSCLRMIPPAALASLVVPALLRPDGELDPFQPRFYAGVIAAAVGWRTRNTIVTLVAGMVALIAMEQGLDWS